MNEKIIIKSMLNRIINKIEKKEINEKKEKHLSFDLRPNFVIIEDNYHKYLNHIINQTSDERRKAIYEYRLELLYNLGIGNIDDLKSTQEQNALFSF
jgi:hypothetical protein|tara:strand:+ start:534 stop:824 length:291 start_codon:yes stop_codon:yes gene_type:complete